MNKQIDIDKEKCTGCGICIAVCPVDAIKLEEGKAVITEECVACTACVHQCPSEAI